MKAAIDASGRIVIPKKLRDEVGLTPGPIEIVSDGSSIRIEPVVFKGLSEIGSRLVIPASDNAIDDEDVSDLRHADQQ